MIKSVPRERLPAQDLARCDYFSESQENSESDICMVVGVGASPPMRLDVDLYGTNLPLNRIFT